jgi:glycosyltransferase involved in cell wall biosynthesis
VPRVSIIIAAYNAERTLGQTLQSVQNQRYTDWEAIVADDGSIDATARIAGDAGPGVRVVRASPNAGVSAARNLGLSVATGELVAFLDSDDQWEPDYLAVMVAAYDAAAATERVGVVCCDAVLQDGERRLDETTGDRFGRPVGRIDAETLVRFNAIHTSAVCPRTVLERVGGFDTGLRVNEDLDLWLRITELGYAVVYVPRALAIYRLSPGGLSTQAAIMARDHQRVLRSALRRGRLSSDAARAARRALRVQQAAEQVALICEQRRTAPLSALLRASVTGPLIARVVLERAIAPLASPAVRSMRQ